MDILKLETKTVLITVKTYPNPSKKHTETVCCAGIDLDTEEWIRLYPIPFRFLDHNKQFPKYSIITVKCEKAPKDKRIESYRVDQDSIKIIDHLDTKNKWLKRKNIVLPTLSPSFCKIFEDIKVHKSLGVFKPCDITFSWKKADLKNPGKRQVPYAQLSFFDQQKKEIEQIPFNFYYNFKCHGRAKCSGHRLLIIDWELGQAYRSWRHIYETEDILLEKIKERWFCKMCTDKYDTHFYVGNQHRFQDQFMVLGVFYPPNAPKDYSNLLG